jgi:hypothetical protein
MVQPHPIAWSVRGWNIGFRCGRLMRDDVGHGLACKADCGDRRELKSDPARGLQSRRSSGVIAEFG